MASEGAKTNFLPTFTVFDNTKKVSFEQKQLKNPFYNFTALKLES